MTHRIRPATAADIPAMHGFILELADYEQARHAVVATEADLERALFGPDPVLHGLVAEEDGRLAGFAVYFFTYSTWLGKPGLYLEDLYITPDARGSGTGRALLRTLAAEARRRDCGRFEWSCLDWNTPAIRFYASIGAVPHPEWIRYRMEGPALEAFAASAD